jgi:hypothetical protein
MFHCHQSGLTSSTRQFWPANRAWSWGYSTDVCSHRCLVLYAILRRTILCSKLLPGLSGKVSSCQKELTLTNNGNKTSSGFLVPEPCRILVSRRQPIFC